MKKAILFGVFFSLFLGITYAQVSKAPDRQEGDGPYEQLIIRGVTLINGNGAPPIGPVDVVVEKNRIKEVKTVGYPGVPIDPADRPKLKEGGKEYDCEGMYLLPGFVDMHGHIGRESSGSRCRVCLQAVDGAWNHDDTRPGMRQRP
jgi:adenine deaminase